MAEYIIQIVIVQESTEGGTYPVGYLGKSFTLTPPSLIPEIWPSSREQIVLTNKNSFDGIVAAFNEYGGLNVQYSYDEPGAKINCSGAVADSWPIN